MKDHPSDLASAEIRTIREHATTASRLLGQVLRGIDEGAVDLLTACLRGVQPHLARLIQADTRLDMLLSVDHGCVAEGLTLRRRKVPEEAVIVASQQVAYRDGPPPADAGWVWREGHHVPVMVHHFTATAFRGGGVKWISAGASEPDEFYHWDTARWAPIPKP